MQDITLTNLITNARTHACIGRPMPSAVDQPSLRNIFINKTCTCKLDNIQLQCQENQD